MIAASNVPIQKSSNINLLTKYPIINVENTKMNEPTLDPNEDKNVNGKIKIINPLKICRNDLFPSTEKIIIAAQAIAAIPPISIFWVVLFILFKSDPLIYFSSR